MINYSISHLKYLSSMNFTGRKVTVMGLGLHGGGVSCANWLIKHGAKVTVTDLKTKEELKPSLDKLAIKRSSDQTIKLVLGYHRENDFRNADLIVQNPGVPRESKYLAIAKKSGVPIENEASLFFKYCPAKIIGVTGTRGKSTTSSLIYQLLKVKSYPDVKSGSRPKRRDKLQARKVWLAGLPQKPMLEILDQIKPNDLVVLELSSWQLEILGEQKLSPQIAVLTNIYPDHLNRYLGMADYVKAKINIFQWQNKNDFVVLNLDNFETKKLGGKVRAKRFLFSKKYFAEQNGSFIKNKQIFFRKDGKTYKLTNLSTYKLIGEHNLENFLAAITVAGIFGVKPKEITAALNKFKGLPGRIELIREKNGVKYINDTTATTPDATMAALKIFLERQIPNSKSQTLSKFKIQNSRFKIILIAGGASKNIPIQKYQELAAMIKKTCKAVILFEGEGSDQMAKDLKAIKFRELVTNVLGMSSAVGIANNFSQTGDIILLSPSSASFGLFINEFDQGDQFNKIVSDI